ncbi:FAD/NAD(P)-binding protein [Desulfosarcina variabilis]|uniref:FAD/NAD(P)-binding protein n=1 Tax=Desulfosarcina variabilis TaxID=2300 RepID=UPI003AFB3DE9
MRSGMNPYRPIRAEVVDVIAETPTIRTLRLRPDEKINFRPGQFIQLTVPGVGEAPFTPSSPSTWKDCMEVTVMRVGKVTEKVHQLKPGDIVGLRGPYGRGYPLEAFVGKDLIVVGGGCGFAPIRTLMYVLLDQRSRFGKLIFRGGCKSPADLLYGKEMDAWAARRDLDLLITVDQGDAGWRGPVGLVTGILDGIDIDCENGVGILCGPPVMMKFSTRKLLQLGLREENLYLSMEKNMSCGIGKCGHCRLGTYYCCKDGPVFNYTQIKDFPDIWG